MASVYDPLRYRKAKRIRRNKKTRMTWLSRAVGGSGGSGGGRPVYPPSGTVPGWWADYLSGVLPDNHNFKRASPATYIGSDGQVKTAEVDEPRFEYERVQTGTTLGPELVTNGGFDLGPETGLDTGFDDESAWDLIVNAAIAGSKLTLNAGGSSRASWLVADSYYPAGAVLEVELEVESLTGNVFLTMIRNDGSAIESALVVRDTDPNGGIGVTKVTYTVLEDSEGLRVQCPTADHAATVLRYSVREVMQGWTLGDGWGWENGQATCDGTQTLNTNLEQDVFEAGKTYEITYTITELTAGQFRLRDLFGTVGPWRTTAGTYTELFTAAFTTFQLQGDVDFIGAVDNVTVREVIPVYAYEPLGLLIEPAATNLLRESEYIERTAPPWSSPGNILTKPGMPDVGGGTAASEVTYNAQYTSLFNEMDAPFPAGDVTAAVWMRCTSQSECVIHLELGRAGAGTPQAVTSEWQWFTLTSTADGTTHDALHIQNRQSDQDGVVIEVCFPQVETGPVATSYIPTGATTETRAADICTADLGDIDLTGEGSTLIDFNTKSTVFGTRALTLSQNSSASRWADEYVENATRFTVYTVYPGIVAFRNDYVAGADTNLAAALKDNTVIHHAMNGDLMLDDDVLTTLQQPTQMNIGASWTASDQLNGHIKRIQLWDTALVDGDLVELTGGTYYLSDNLVLNGDFEEIGPEWVVNGTFNGDTGWAYNNDDPTDIVSTFADGTLKTVRGSGGILNRPGQDIGSASGKYLVVKTDVVSGSNTGGRAFISNPVLSLVAGSGPGTYSLQGVGGGETLVSIWCDNNHDVTVDNVSVREVMQNWTLGDGWYWEDGQAKCDGSQTANSTLRQDGIVTATRTYEVTYTLTEVIAGQFRAQLTGASGEWRNTPGTYTDVLVAGGANLLLQADIDFVGAVDNIIVREVDDGSGTQVTSGFVIETPTSVENSQFVDPDGPGDEEIEINGVSPGYFGTAGENELLLNLEDVGKGIWVRFGDKTPVIYMVREGINYFAKVPNIQAIMASMRGNKVPITYRVDNG